MQDSTNPDGLGSQIDVPLNMLGDLIEAHFPIDNQKPQAVLSRDPSLTTFCFFTEP